jgi:DNA-binding CsgD family transcriptional regulator
MEPDAMLAGELLGLGGRGEYLRAASELLLELFPGENVAWNVLDVQAPSAEVRPYPDRPYPDVSQILLDVWEDHPLVRSYVGDGGAGVWQPRRLSDLVTDRQLYRTRAYKEGLEPLGSNRQLAFLVARPSRFSIRGWAMNRAGVDFTDHEMDVARRIQPVLRLVDAAFSGGFRDRPGNSAACEELTARELEILELVSKGLTSGAAAHLLGISPRTVAKHLEHAYAKLGCTNRVDALRTLREGRQPT